MDTSLVVLEFFGIYFIISGLFVIFKGKTLPGILKDLFGHPAMSYIIGLILTFLSILFLLEHNIWDGTSKTVATVLVWMVLIKGLMYLFAPKVLYSIASKKFLDNLNIFGVIIILAGVMLLYFI